MNLQRKDADGAVSPKFSTKQYASFRFGELKFSDSGPSGSFKGYGSVFNNVDLGGDVVVKGAFKKTIQEWKRGDRSIKMLWQHGGGGFGGSAADQIPIGKWTSIEEDDHGLKMEGQLLALDTEMGKRLHAAMKEEQIDQMSIGYIAREVIYGKSGEDFRRKLKTVELMEVSLVLFGMNPKTSVDGVKGQISTVRDFEDFLRDVGGFSRADAKAIASRGFKAASLRDADGSASGLDDYARQIAVRAASIFNVKK